VHNIDFDVTRDHVLRLFGIFGRVKFINMPSDNKNRPRGLAFVTYWEHDDALKALNGGKTMILGGRKLRVEVFKPLETLNQERKRKVKGPQPAASTTHREDVSGLKPPIEDEAPRESNYNNLNSGPGPGENSREVLLK
jgi:RNA recognition motif-containing protein